MSKKLLDPTTFGENPPWDPNIGKFKSTSPLGFASPALWTLKIPNPAGLIAGDNVNFEGLERDLMFLCNRAMLSGRHFSTNEINTYGPIRKMPWQSIYDELQVSMYCRVNLTEKKFFDAWQNLIHNKEGYEWAYYEKYTHTLDLTCYSPQSTEVAKQLQTHLLLFQGMNKDFLEEIPNGLFPTHKIKLYNAYPLNIQPIALDWGTQNEIMRLDVTFTYRQWVSQNVPGYENVGIEKQETKQGPTLGDFLSWASDTLERVDLYTGSLPEWMKTASRNFRPEAISGTQTALGNKFGSLF